MSRFSCSFQLRAPAKLNVDTVKTGGLGRGGEDGAGRRAQNSRAQLSQPPGSFLLRQYLPGSVVCVLEGFVWQGVIPTKEHTIHDMAYVWGIGIYNRRRLLGMRKTTSD